MCLMFSKVRLVFNQMLIYFLVTTLVLGHYKVQPTGSRSLLPVQLSVVYLLP